MASKSPKTPQPKITFDTNLFLATVADGRKSVKYKAKDIIFRQGDPANAVYYLEKGSVQITVLSEQGSSGLSGNRCRAAAHRERRSCRDQAVPDRRRRPIMS